MFAVARKFRAKNAGRTDGSSPEPHSTGGIVGMMLRLRRKFRQQAGRLASFGI
jgi:hypothetical protein